jgi:hypothetical protein
MRLPGRAALRNLRGCHDRGTHVWLHWAAYWSIEMVVVLSTSYTLLILSGTDGSSREPIHATAICINKHPARRPGLKLLIPISTGICRAQKQIITNSIHTSPLSGFKLPQYLNRLPYLSMKFPWHTVSFRMHSIESTPHPNQ